MLMCFDNLSVTVIETPFMYMVLQSLQGMCVCVCSIALNAENSYIRPECRLWR